MAKQNRVETADKVRVQLDVTSAQLIAMDQIMTYCDLSKRKELFDVSMSLFAWAVEEARKGNRIASYNQERDHVETIIVPALEAARSRASQVKRVDEGPVSEPISTSAESDVAQHSSSRSNVRALGKRLAMKSAVAN